MFHQELRSFSTPQLVELIKDKHVYEDNEQALIDLIEERGENTREELEGMDFGSLEFLAYEAIDWMDREQLLDFINAHSLFLI